ncbi:Arginine permease [Madurella mycetomatis]|uniref:Arginine permease n=1 Tax=Madurella mycetomatis TaxID=100816 RepID=A0A175VUM2_9PEZI|nr:Arginine permease [Madurella mycetomatis]KXX74730.1 Arginine permease [Madurella mycetomatis]
MDYEKPEALHPQIFPHPGHQSPQPDGETTLHGFDESAVPEDRREFRGDSLWRVLHERHINMIAFSGTIGNGLFLGSGRSLAGAGPGGAVVCYVLMGTVISSVISCLGEMTALMPVNAPVMEFSRRFVSRGVGFAVGWVYWFAYAVLAGEQLVAVSNAIKFRYDDGTTFLSWEVGERVDNAVWITVFLVVVVLLNMLPVRVFGELEYIFGCFKLMFITMLIMLMFFLSIIQPLEGSYHSEPLGTRYWNTPYSFFNPTYTSRDEYLNIKHEITGSLGTLLGVWTTFTNVLFSYIGMDIVAATAAESKALADVESMKMAARKINLRAVTLYSLAMLTSSFVVPMDHPFINGKATSVSARSVFIIAVVEAGLPKLAHFFNAVFVFSAFTCAINSMYIATRVLHTLALRGQTGPEFITRRLRQCRSGVPVRSVLATAAIMMVAYMGRHGTPGARLDELANNCTVSCLIMYATICATYLLFFRTLENAKLYGNTSESQAASYDRDNPLYPYKSHGQWLKASYGMVACIILIFFNGVGAFIDPFNVRKFVAAYIGIPVFILLILGYNIRKHRLRFADWWADKSGDLSNTVQAGSLKRKGRLEFPDNGVTKENLLTFVQWIWVWMK